MAQVSGAIDVGSGVGRVQSGTWVRESRLAPSVRLNHRFGFLHTDAALLERGGTMQLDRAAYHAVIASPAFGPFRLAGGVTGTSDSVYSTLSLRRPEMTAALSAAYRRSGVWLGTSARSGGSPAIVAGAWRTLGAAVVSVYSTRRSSAARALEFREREVAGWDTTVTDSGSIARP